MEKLLKLLNEYKPTNDVEDKEYLFKNGSIWIKYFTFGGETEYVNINTLILSKKFGFIHWLVDRKEFDYWKVGEIVDKYKGSLREKAYVVSDCEDESMLMLLAIQDDPISFLISVLK